MPPSTAAAAVEGDCAQGVVFLSLFLEGGGGKGGILQANNLAGCALRERCQHQQQLRQQ
jgi:hypothetical protein